MDFLNANASVTYKPKLDHTKKIKDMQLKPKTKAILAIIYKKFWCDDAQQREFNNTLKNNEIRYQTELREKYNPDNLFKKKIETVENPVAMVEYKESVFIKIKNWIKRTF